jgi:polyisoprenoid-binding protein YceI
LKSVAASISTNSEIILEDTRSIKSLENLMKIEQKVKFLCLVLNSKFIEMKRALLFLTISGLFFVNAGAQNKLTADTTATKLLWIGEKVTGQHTGTIKLQSGWLNWQDNKIVSGEFIIDMKSLKDSENNAMLQGHLKSDEFFGVEKSPTSKLMITGSTPFVKGNGVVSGTLTIKDITIPIEFKAVMQKKDDGTWFFANITVDRTKYNIRYGSGSFFDDLGDKTIYDEFNIKVSLLVK